MGTHGVITWNLLIRGKTQAARKNLEACKFYGDTCDSIVSKCYSYLISAFHSLVTGNTEELVEYAKKGADLANEHGLVLFQAFSGIHSSLSALQRGDLAGLDSYKRFEAKFLATGSRFCIPFYRIEAARLALGLDLYDEAAALIEKSKALMDETGEVYALSDLHRLQAHLSMYKSDSQTAEAKFLLALEVARQHKAELWELRASIDLARLWQDQDKVIEAIALLKPIHDSIDDDDCPDDQAIARELLTALTSTSRG